MLRTTKDYRYWILNVKVVESETHRPHTEGIFTAFSASPHIPIHYKFIPLGTAQLHILEHITIRYASLSHPHPISTTDIHAAARYSHGITLFFFSSIYRLISYDTAAFAPCEEGDTWLFVSSVGISICFWASQWRTRKQSTIATTFFNFVCRCKNLTLIHMSERERERGQEEDGERESDR